MGNVQQLTFSDVGFGSKAWANKLLRDGIKELKNTNRACSGRFCEVIVYIGLLLEHGYWWQATRLRNHLYLHWESLQPRRADHRRSEEPS